MSGTTLYHPLAVPLLRICLWLIGSGVVFITVLGLLRRSQGATYRNDWLRLAVMLGIGSLILALGAFGRWTLLPGAMFVTYLGWRELMGCVEARYGHVPAQRLFPALAALGIAGGLTGDTFGAFLGIAVTAWSAAVLPMVLHGRPVPMASMLSMGLGSVLISVPVTHLLLLVQLDFGAFAFLIVLINCHDGFSVGFGRLLGRHALCPQISPGKTWEGAAGGLLVCLGIGTLVDFLVPGWPRWQVLLASALVATLALLGDLVASSLKREARVKDFGTSLPGMGGIMDRFDGLLFIAPMFYAFVRLLGTGGG